MEPLDAEQRSRHSLALDDSWRRLVRPSRDTFARPDAVEIDGAPADVTNAEGLLGGPGEQTTLVATADGGTRLVVDFGRVVSGWVELGVRAAAGAPIRLAYSEGRQFLGRGGDAATDPDDFFYNGYTLGSDAKPDGRVDVFDPPVGPAVLRSAGLRGAQRYLAVSLDGPGSVTIDFVRIEQTNRPSSYDGHFLCDDELLNEAWFASAHTLDLATIRNTRRNPDARWVITDGPKRDRLAYGANMSVAGIAAYFQDHGYRDVVRDTLNLFAFQQEPDGTLPAASEIDVPCVLGDPGPPTGPPEGFGPPAEAGMARLDSYSAWWVTCLDDYLLWTGDTDFVTPLLPVARRVVDLLESHVGEDGLVRNDLYGKTYTINWHPPDPAIGADAWENASYVGTLRALARLERDVARDEAAAARWEARAEQVRLALISALWDDEVGAMLQNTEAPKPDHTGDGNAAALLLGLLDADQANRSMAFLEHELASPFGTLTSEHGDNEYMTRFVSPYILTQEAQGRIRHGDDLGALRLLRLCWGAMLRFGPGTTWEQVGADGTPGGAGTVGGGGTSLSHPWSSCVPVLSGDVLGVRPIADGFTRWAVEPHPGDLRWAQGAVPTPGGGLLTVRWERAEDDDSFTITVSAPEGTTGRVAVPLLGADRTVALDGRVVWRDGAAADGTDVTARPGAIVVDGLTGTATLAWSVAG